jgi:hypothetical protein
MGEAYLATEAGLGREVTLKLLAPEFAPDPRFRERFIAESPWRPRSTIPTSSRSTRPARPTAGCSWRCVTSRATTSGRSSPVTAGSSRNVRSAPCPASPRPSMRPATGASSSATSSPQRPRRPDGPRRGARLPRRLGADQAARLGRRLHPDGPARRLGQLRRARADRGSADRSPGRRLLPRLRPVHRPCRPAAVSARDRCGDPPCPQPSGLDTAWQPALSPDGARLAFSREEAGRVPTR